MRFQVMGHSYLRTLYYYGEDGTAYTQAYTLPGGAALLSKLLHEKDERNCPFDPLDQEEYHREFFELGKHTKRMGGEAYPYFSSTRRLGKKAGRTDTAFGEGEYAVVWDQGFGGLDASAVGKKKAFWASRRTLPDREAFNPIAENTFLMLDARVLRRAGAMISEAVSWERTVMNLLWQLRNNDSIAYLLNAPHLLIAFAEDGLVYMQTEKDEKGERHISAASLMLTSGKSEGTLKSQNEGHLGEAFAVMAASAVLQFPEVMAGKTMQFMPILQSGKMVIEAAYQEKTLEE